MEYISDESAMSPHRFRQIRVIGRNYTLNVHFTGVSLRFLGYFWKNPLHMVCRRSNPWRLSVVVDQSLAETHAGHRIAHPLVGADIFTHLLVELVAAQDDRCGRDLSIRRFVD
jgi:hypothetical protein